MSKRGKAVVAAPTMPERKSVDIKKASNGFVVSQWTEKGERCFVEKTKEEAQKYAQKLLK